MQRRLVLILATAASACLLSGCVVFTGLITGAQPDIVGKLRLTFTVCASGFDDGDDPDPENEDHPGCPDDGNGDAYAFDGPHQLLFALRVPVGTGTPATISATPGPAPPASGPIVLSRNASYAAELQSAVPAPAGTRGANSS